MQHVPHVASGKALGDSQFKTGDRSSIEGAPMIAPLTQEEKKRLLKAFKMPVVQSMRSRKTSITNAFVSTIIPVMRPTPEEIGEALAVLGMNAESINCAYCGDKCNAWDHLRPLVVNRRPTGFISEITNLVPACQPCNSSKTNSHWKDWMLRTTGNSPSQRGVADMHFRVQRLEAFERWRSPTKIDFEAILGTVAYEAYWVELDRIIAELEKSQQMADTLRETISTARANLQLRVQKSPAETGEDN
ncbi:MAG TPA: HNH endonuclease [Tepidisphaeraceae bacterium]